MATCAKRDVVQKLYRGVDPFAFFVANESDVDFQGWGSNHSYLQEVIQSVQPGLVVEIGVWKGGSSMFMAENLKKFNLQSAIISIDTWLGAEDHWINNKWFDSLKIQGGMPVLQKIFMTNVKAKSLDEFIIPLPLDSTNAFYVLKHFSLKPDVVHIDAGHRYESVFSDISLWWTTLPSRGVMICDDYCVDSNGVVNGWPDVHRAVHQHLDDAKDIAEFKYRAGKCWIRKQ